MLVSPAGASGNAEYRTRVACGQSWKPRGPKFRSESLTVVTSHRRTVQSSDAVAIKASSADQQASEIPSSCPSKLRKCLPVEASNNSVVQLPPAKTSCKRTSCRIWMKRRQVSHMQIGCCLLCDAPEAATTNPSKENLTADTGDFCLLSQSRAYGLPVPELVAAIEIEFLRF